MNVAHLDQGPPRPCQGWLSRKEALLKVLVTIRARGGGGVRKSGMRDDMGKLEEINLHFLLKT